MEMEVLVNFTKLKKLKIKFHANNLAILTKTQPYFGHTN